MADIRSDLDAWDVAEVLLHAADSVPDPLPTLRRWRLAVVVDARLSQRHGRLDALMDPPLAWPLTPGGWDALERAAEQDARGRYPGVDTFMLLAATPMAGDTEGAP